MVTSRKRKQAHREARERAKAKSDIRTLTLAELKAAQEGGEPPDSPEVEAHQTNFGQVPVEADTTLHDRQYLLLEGLDIQWEPWYWDGVAGETAVFIEDQLGSTGDQALKELVRNSGQLAASGPMTVSRKSNGYAFINFNFRT